MKIWKFKLPHYKNEVNIPAKSFNPIYVQFQRNQYGDGLSVWIEVEPDKTISKKYTFYALSTGEKIPEGGVYIGSAEDPDSHEMVHVYWINEKLFLSEEEMKI